MIGLRGGERILPHRTRQQYDHSGQGSTKGSQQTDKSAGVFIGPWTADIEPKPSSNAIATRRCQTPDPRPIRVGKVRKQRGSQASSTDEHVKTPGVYEMKTSGASKAPRYYRRIPLFASFNLSRKVSTQELVASVKEAYHSRPSLNLSRPKDNGNELRVHTINDTGQEENNYPALRKWHLSSTKYSGAPLSPLRSDDSHERSVTTGQSSVMLLRRLSSKYRRTLRPRRRSRSFDDVSDVATSTSASTASSIWGDMKDGDVTAKTLDFNSTGTVEQSTPRNSQPHPVPLSFQLLPRSEQQPSGSQYNETVRLKDSEGTDVAKCSGLHVEAVGQIHELDVSATSSFWIALRLQYHISSATLERTKDKPICVVLLIDNLSFDSEAAIEESCELVFAIARYLNRPRDLLAVFTTACCHGEETTGGAAGCQLHPLRKPSMRILRKELSKLADLGLPGSSASSRERRTSEDRLQQTIETALSLVLEDNPRMKQERNLQFLSISCKITTSGPDTLSTMPIYSRYLVGLRAPVDGSAVDKNGPTHPNVEAWASEFLSNARASTELRPLCNVFVDLQPGRSTEVLEILGNPNATTFVAGQTKCLLVEVEVDRASPGRLSSPGASLDTMLPPASVEEALYDLYYVLGEMIQPILNISVLSRPSYEDNDSATLATCNPVQITRRNSASVWSSRSQPQPRAPQTDKLDAFLRGVDISDLYQTLDAECIDSSTNLRALDMIESLFSERDLSEGVLRHFQTLRRHLKPDGAFPAPQVRALSGSIRSESPQIGRLPFELRNVDLGRPRQSVSPSTETVSTMRASPLPRSQGQTDDEARKIWRLMRRDSKTQEQLEIIAAKEEMHDADRRSEEVKELRRRAVMNKRSVGADTLRSMAYPASNSDEMLAAPWM